MKDFKPDIGLIVLLCCNRNHPKHKQLLRLVSAALALTLAVGAVPFLRGFAAEEDAAVSGSDIVSMSDAAVTIAGETVEPKPSYAVFDEGRCGENVTWTLDDEGTLTFSGTGAMTYTSWRQHSDRIKKAVIENGVTNIIENAFFECTSLTSVSIPDTVTSIGDHAFIRCNSLSSVVIPDKVTSIGEFAFSGCKSLNAVNIPNDVNFIGNYAFYNCSALTSVDIPGKVTSIGNYVFSNCTSLNSVNISDGVTSIGECAFLYCGALRSVNIPDSMKSIGNMAFSNCSALASVNIPDSVTSLGELAFTNCSALTSVTLPKNLNVIPYALFAQCTHLTEVTIGYVATVKNYAFDQDNALTTVNYPCDHDISGIQSVFPNHPTFKPMHSYEWVIDKESTDTEPGEKHEECTVCHAKQKEHTEIPVIPVTPVTPVINVTEGDGGTHKIKKDGDLHFTFVYEGHNDDTYQAFEDALNETPPLDVVTVRGKNYSKTLTINTEYKAEPGSLRLTLTKNYLDILKPGDYTFTVKFKISGSVYKSSSTFKIASSGINNPGTGESIVTVVSAMILFILSLSVLAYMAYTDKLFRAKLLAVPAGITSFFSRSDAHRAENDND